MTTTPSPRPGGKRQRTLALIAATAWQLFERDGYEAVTMEQIAEAAGVAKATLYNHCATKDAVLVCAIHHQLADDLGGLTAPWPSGTGMPEGIGVLLDSMAHWAESHRVYLPPYLRQRFLDVRTPTPDLDTDGTNDVVDVYAQLIRQSQADGVLREDIDAGHLAALFHHLCLGALLRWLNTPGLDLRQELGVALDLFVRGAATTPPHWPRRKAAR